MRIAPYLCLPVAVCALFMAACSEPEPKTSKPSAEPTPSKPTMVTSGTVIFVDVPYEGVTSREIITIPSMSAGLRGELERQRQLFEDKLVGGVW